MNNTIEELKHTIEELKSRVAELSPTSDEVVSSVKQNPLPYAVTGLGIAATIGQALKSALNKPQPPTMRERVASAADNARHSVSQFADTAKEKIHDAGDAVAQKAEDVRGRLSKHTHRTPSTLVRARDIVTENPFLCGAGVIATGFIAGLLIPATRSEKAWFGETGRQFIDDAKAAGLDAVEEGKAIAKETIAAADSVVRDTAKETRETIREKFSDADSAVRDTVRETGQAVREKLSEV